MLVAVGDGERKMHIQTDRVGKLTAGFTEAGQHFGEVGYYLGRRVSSRPAQVSLLGCHGNTNCQHPHLGR